MQFLCCVRMSTYSCKATATLHTNTSQQGRSDNTLPGTASLEFGYTAIFWTQLTIETELTYLYTTPSTSFTTLAEGCTTNGSRDTFKLTHRSGHIGGRGNILPDWDRGSLKVEPQHSILFRYMIMVGEKAVLVI